MKRKAVLLDRSKHDTTRIYADLRNAGQILTYVHRDNVIDEFKDIRGILKENLRNRQFYCKVNVSDKAKDIFEMRFTRNRKNGRIYCKEVHQGKIRKIVMIELYEGKKSQRIPKKIINRINNMSYYEYEFQEK